MVEKEIEIVNKLGLHARAAAVLVQEASKFDSEIKIIYEDKNVDAKSILGVMMLAAMKGDVIKLKAEGEDEIEAMEAIEKLIKDRFGEKE
ncbi:MAG: HPr family phosphocarrier protein [Candidatus Mcinerneyibacterium aminivorans]|uniref:HPr family phosphocarrier protein n=1 Tax=Candidatus Mcinerneyibacterium aminivorans TaxID=2703815 RepID=A0A5D0MFR6_9BACT|nr:MAG: HPr family phosphocarrier protein [Candidatus Mcinerneyibacterium aminivorans]